MAPYFVTINLIGKLQWLLWWNIVLFIQIYGKLSKLLQASEKPCHGFVKSGAPEQIYRAKQFICIVVDVGDSWIASHRVNLDPVLKFRSEILSHGMQQQCSLTPSSIYLIPLNLHILSRSTEYNESLWYLCILWPASYLSIWKTSEAEVVYCSNYTIMWNMKCIIENISTLQQFQMNLRNFYLSKNCVSFFLDSADVFQITKWKCHQE